MKEKIEATVGTVFKLVNMYRDNKIKLDKQTIDRKEGEFTMKLMYNKKEFYSPEELYNYITKDREDLRKYSDVRDFKDTEVKVLYMIQNKDNIVSTLEFKLGYETFKVTTIKEIV